MNYALHSYITFCQILNNSWRVKYTSVLKAWIIPSPTQTHFVPNPKHVPPQADPLYWETWGMGQHGLQHGGLGLWGSQCECIGYLGFPGFCVSTPGPTWAFPICRDVPLGKARQVLHGLEKPILLRVLRIRPFKLWSTCLGPWAVPACLHSTTTDQIDISHNLSTFVALLMCHEKG